MQTKSILLALFSMLISLTAYSQREFKIPDEKIFIHAS